MLPFLLGVDHVELESSGERPSSEAWLLAGWLASRLGWPEDGSGPAITMHARPDRGVEGSGVLGVRLRCRLDGRTAEVSVHREGASTVTRIATGKGLAAVATMSTRAADLYELVGRELQEVGEDRIYTAALRRAAGIADTVPAQ